MTGQRTVHTQHGPISAETADAIEQEYGQGALVLAIQVRSHDGALRTMLKGTSDTGTQLHVFDAGAGRAW